MKKSNQMSESLILAAVLTLSGGFMDAYSYICRGQVFANAQTGNILLFGVNLSTGNMFDALCYLCPVLAFMAGIAVTEFVQHLFKYNTKIHWRQIIVLAEAVILFGVAFFPQQLNLAANSLTSFACGAQVEGFRKVQGHVAATTMCIGNLRTATQSICDHLFSNKSESFSKGILFYGIIGIFVCGAVIGNFAVGLFREKSIMISSALMIAAFWIMEFDKKSRSGQ